MIAFFCAHRTNIVDTGFMIHMIQFCRYHKEIGVIHAMLFHRSQYIRVWIVVPILLKVRINTHCHILAIQLIDWIIRHFTLPVSECQQFTVISINNINAMKPTALVHSWTFSLIKYFRKKLFKCD